MQALRKLTQVFSRIGILCSKHCAVATAISIFPLAVQAEPVSVFFDGNDLYELCQSRTEAAGFLARAWADAAAVHEMTPKACIPSNATATQLSDTFCQYLAKNPDKRHFPAAEMFQIAASEAWVCRKVVVDRCTGKVAVPGAPEEPCSPQNEWKHITVPDFLDKHPEYAEGGELYPILDNEVRKLQATAENPFASTLLDDAHRIIIGRAAGTQ